MIDLHCHLLPGVDDGPATLQDSLAMARAACEAGIDTAVATPHIDHRWRVDPQAVAGAVRDLQAAVDEAGIPLRVLPGGEVALPRLVELGEAEVAGVRLGDGPYLLLECPHTTAAGSFDMAVTELARRGEQIVLAHPERCPWLLRHPGRLSAMVKQGLLCSVTAGALEGAFGRAVRDFAVDLLRGGLVHNIASDSHDASRREPQLLAGLRAAEPDVPGVLEQAVWLTEDVPAAILAGEPLPDRPPLPPPARRLRGLLARRRG